MAVRADMISNRRHVQRALQAVGFVALLGLAMGAVLTASGVFAGGLTASSVKPAYAPIDTNTPTPTSTPTPCDPVWSVVSSPNGGVPSGLSDVDVVTANDVWAVGYSQDQNHTVVEHWDGTSWSVIPSPNVNNNSYLWGVGVVSANDVWAVGSSCSGCSPSHTVVEHWDGTSWSVVPSLDPGTNANVLYGVGVVSATDVWAVGYYYNGSSPYHTLIEHWDGTSWSVVSSPNVGTNDNTLSKAAAVSANDVWAVGSGNGTLVEHWDGTSWSVVSSPNIGALNDVDVVTANDVWAVNGSIIHWDGTSWSVVSSPNVGTLYGVAAVSANDVWAVGYNDNGGIGRTLVEHYAPLCGTPTLTPTPSATAIINGHLTWQAVAPANRPSVTGTLQLCVNGSTQTFNITTDTGGYFTVTYALSDGTYHWWIKGGRHLASSSPADGADLVIINGHATQEFGIQKGGNCCGSHGNGPPDNIVQSGDFVGIKQQFGMGGIRSADFDYNNVVNAVDFNILKSNFGQAGRRGLICP